MLLLELTHVSCDAPSAIRRLHQDSKKASDDILGLLNVIVDSYCFKNRSVEHMNFLKLNLRRKFSAAEARHRRMLTLLDDAWWEQCFGLHYLLGFNRVIMRNYVNLVGSLLGDLQTLSCAMRLEQCEQLHVIYMKVLQRQIYVIQTRSGDLLNEISREIHASSAHLNLKTMHSLENQVETTLYKYRKLQNRTLRTQTVTIDAMAGNVALNLFLFSLNSFCSTLLNFQQSHNSKRYGDVHRVRSFLLASFKRFVERAHYERPSTWAGALKGTVALMLGVFLAVYIYGFSATVPSTIAYIMGNHLGGSFQITANRVGGVVAGSVVPSVFKFFFVQACSPEYLGVVLSNLLLFVWVGLSMYVYFARGYSSYGGLVSAFIAADILLRQSDMCYPNGSDSSKSIAIASYSSLAQTSVAVVIFIAVESFLFPKSAVTLLRHSIQDTLKLHQRTFDVLFGHHLSSSIAMDDETMAEIRHILEIQIPRKLVKQKLLLLETRAEPLMWRPVFSLQKYERVLEISHRLLNNNYMLFKLLRWFHYRVTKNRVKLSPVDIRDDPDGTNLETDDLGSHQTKWQLASNHFESLVRDNFETMELVFSDSFLYSDPDQMSIFMQMKEAFRLADRDCSGELSSEDVAAMLETIVAQSGSVKKEEIQQYVQDFMAVVGKADSDSVSFEQFMEALEHGLKLEVEVSHRRKSMSLALPIGDKLSDKVKDAVAVGRPNGACGSATEIRLGSLIMGEGSDHKEERGSEDRQESDGDASKTPSTSQTARVLRPIHAGAGNEELGTNAETSEFCTSMPMRREYDVLNVEDFSITEIVAQMKTAYVEWVLEDKRYEQVSMEEQLLLNCLISGAEGIAKNLTDLEEITASS
ncbi:hypothetical protein BBJ28_00000429 [Nothophytophthora sp. Chile5]|nr:hypothetical protein BBJ28_00000429 [Nothophytophthora sp. Chile5]